MLFLTLSYVPTNTDNAHLPNKLLIYNKDRHSPDESEPNVYKFLISQFTTETQFGERERERERERGREGEGERERERTMIL